MHAWKKYIFNKWCNWCKKNIDYDFIESDEKYYWKSTVIVEASFLKKKWKKYYQKWIFIRWRKTAQNEQECTK